MPLDRHAPKKELNKKTLLSQKSMHGIVTVLEGKHKALKELKLYKIRTGLLQNRNINFVLPLISTLLSHFF